MPAGCKAPKSQLHDFGSAAMVVNARTGCNVPFSVLVATVKHC